MPRTGGGGMTMMKASWIARELLCAASAMMRRRCRPFAARSSNGVERREDGAGVRRVGEGGAVEAGERHGVRDARRVQHDLGGLRHDRVGARQRGAGRQLDDGDQIALVLLRDEAGRRAPELPAGEPDQAGIDDEHRRRDAHQPRGQRAVAVRQPSKPRLKPLKKRMIGRASSDPRGRVLVHAA